jgi:hypothetical protein
MPNSLPPQLLSTFRALAEVVYSGDSYEAVYERVCAAAVELVEGCDHASLMEQRGPEAVTLAASDDVAQQVDDLERAVGAGPCLDAMDDSQPDHHCASNLNEDSQWPELAERVVAETPVRGMGGFRIRYAERRLGALNVFSDRAGALDQSSMDRASMLAAFASVALAALGRGEEASTLRRGLESNREIGKAIGLIMAMHDVSDERAFEMLAKISQDMNIKVSEVAAQVVRQHRER